MSDMSRRRRMMDVPTLVQLEGPLAADRAEAEGFVCAAFLTAYEARVEHFLPTLMALRNDSTSAMGASPESTAEPALGELDTAAK